jgi:hypothetical protein
VLHGVVELQWQVIAALSVFLLSLGLLLRWGDLRIPVPVSGNRRRDGSELADAWPGLRAMRRTSGAD